MLAPYTLWLLAFNILPLIILWVVFYDALKSYVNVILKCIGCSIIAGVLWDIVAIKGDIWYWPAGCCDLPRTFGLPLEEPLFMACTTALIATMTLIARDFLLKRRNQKKAKR